MLAGWRPAWMGKPYSLDLRKRVVAAIESGMSRNQAAKQFGVAISTAIGWMKRDDKTGSDAPGQWGGHKQKAVSGDQAVWLSQRIKDGDFTIRGLVAELAGRGLKVDYHSVWDFVHAEKLSFKKKRGGWRPPSTRDRAAADPGSLRPTRERDDYSSNRIPLFPLNVSFRKASVIFSGS